MSSNLIAVVLIWSSKFAFTLRTNWRPLLTHVVTAKITKSRWHRLAHNMASEAVLNDPPDFPRSHHLHQSVCTGLSHQARSVYIPLRDSLHQGCTDAACTWLAKLTPQRDLSEVRAKRIRRLILRGNRLIRLWYHAASCDDQERSLEEKSAMPSIRRRV